MFKWARKAKPSYEVSSRGDQRFSALFATMPDGRTIEVHYQCDIKGYDVGGKNWLLGKGKPPLNITMDEAWEKYLALWRVWAQNNLPLMRILYRKASENGYTLTDMFASSQVNQARALSTILNELSKKG